MAKRPVSWSGGGGGLSPPLFGPCPTSPSQPAPPPCCPGGLVAGSSITRMRKAWRPSHSSTPHQYPCNSSQQQRVSQLLGAPPQAMDAWAALHSGPGEEEGTLDPVKPHLEPVAQIPPLDEEGQGAAEGRGEEGPRGGRRRGRKKKKYHRHRKPPYTYLAMIALVIRASPQRKLTLSQIIKEISNLFPFFKEGYQGWKDSIRHNLSANNCFQKVLKDPTKPQAKGNFWTVDLNLIPPEALKLQNTAISRQEETTFTLDLAPFVYNGWDFNDPQPPPNGPVPEGSRFLSSERWRSPFSIDALLQDFQGVGLSGKARAESGPLQSPTAASDVWGTVPIFRVSSGAPVMPWRGPCPLPTLRSLSSPSSPASLRSLSPSEEAKRAAGTSISAKRPRIIQPAPDTSDSDSREGSPPPAPATPFWEQLPTSYTPCVAPNVVVAPEGHAPAPFSTNPAFQPYSALPFSHPTYWEVMPGSSLSPVPSSGVDLGLEDAMPPNKTVFDVWMSHPMDIVQPAFPQMSPSSRNSVLTHYDPS
ncbi:LOW QUALITY PROTEIN: forkhead box protein H1-like [Erythrolamprus reginae]|uniref:LOW QUALITY PROTEIN: forkhead box protein H1-like n=1 Tax=Erythrolamprus reginae TaxID=121349 RepID=UPI00396C9E3F